MNFSDQLQARVCPVCNSDDPSHVLFPASMDAARLDQFAFASRKQPELMHLRLLQCPRCTLVYASPAFTPDFLAAAYGEAAYDSATEATYAARTYAAELPAIMERLPSAGSALEIGSGNGAFLRHLKQAGFGVVQGVEPSLRACGTARDEERALIRVGMFDPRDFDRCAFDLVTCFQTMEHLDRPRDFCASVFELLKPGGALYLVVHDYASWVTRALGRKSPIFDVEHLQLFSHASLRYMLGATGYENVEIRSICNRYPLSYWVRLLPLPRSLKKMLGCVLRYTAIGRIPISVNLGNLAVIGYRPTMHAIDKRNEP